MAELRAVFEMAIKHMGEPDLDSWREQERRQRKASRNKKAGAMAGAAVLLIAGVVVGIGALGDDDGQPASDAPAVEPRPAPWAGGSVTTAPWVAPSAIPDVDYLVDLTSGAMTPLPEAIIRSSLGKSDEIGVAQTHYAVSPDGAQLAYVGTGEDGTPQIFISGIDGTGIRQVTYDPVGADWPAWSPDGTKLAYEGVVEDRIFCCRDLFVLDVATGESTRIVEGEALAHYGLQFTPDGSSLVYTGGDGRAPVGAEMRTVPVAGGQSTILFGGGHRGIGHAGQGSLSPDGSLVTFMGHEVGGPGAGRFVVNADGTELRSIPGRETNPAGLWSPDGSRIVALKSDTRHGGIVVVDVVTGDALLVAEGRQAIWLDDHTLLVEV